MIHLSILLAESKLKLNIPSDIKKIYKLFKKNRKQLFVVGGAVRDAILGKSPKDFDLATDAKPDEVLQIAKQGGFNTAEVGKSFGVVIVGGHEIATFRKDIGKGRRPKAVDFTDIKGDVMRRDLTINALFYDMGRGEIVDLVGGIKDLQKKQVRTVGDATARFAEDPLRKLRAVRFTASVGGKMHADTFNALKQDSNLGGISRERIRDEFVKGLIKAQHPQKYLKLIDKLKMIHQIFPQIKVNKKFINTNKYQIQIAYLLMNNKINKVETHLKLNKYTKQEIRNIVYLLQLKYFNVKNIFIIKKNQGLTTLTNNDMLYWGKLIGKYNLISKLLKFKLSIKGGDLAKSGIKGSDIQDKIKDMEYKKFMGVG